MDRRAFLAARTSRVPAPSPSPPHVRGIQSGLNPYTGAWGTRQVAHLLKRTMFGAKKADIDYFRSRTPSQAIDELLSIPATPPPHPVKNYDNTNISPADPDYAIPQGQTWVNINTNDGNANSRRVASFKSWWLGLMINQDRNILEKMVLFWHNHFATETNDIGRAIWCYQNNVILRQYALGNFKQFVRAITLDTGMLRYLNGYLNSNTAPDENYARELQELFTLGKENNPNYTEDDVKQAARVLTGWRIDNNTNTYFFQANRHDTGNKQFSSFFNNKIITGRSGNTAGDLELDELLNMIFAKQVEVSRFIVKKLYRWFCYYTIDAATESNVIEPLAAQFRTNWEIKPVLATLLKSEHFFDPLNQGCIIKTPIDVTVGMCREFNIQFPPLTDYVNSYFLWEYLRGQAATAQMNLGDPPSVSGWPSYYQEPQYYEIWINSDTLPKRNRFTDQLVNPGYSRNGKKIQLDPVSFAKALPNAADPNALINDSLEILYMVPLSDANKEAIKRNILLSGQDQDYYWSNTWYAYIAGPNDNMAYQMVYTRLRDLYKYLMNLPEYQLA
ncbi:MAG TPA: DUF1800 domain-containing protein [Chitinophagaceae bacterium]|nr:DUF1800 domain-containing protein [Chitinophagaceae bacterium]